MAMAVIQMLLIYQMSSIFEGFVAVKLPFNPFNFFSGMSHRGISGEDMSQGSLFFVYMVA